MEAGASLGEGVQGVERGVKGPVTRGILLLAIVADGYVGRQSRTHTVKTQPKGAPL
jgi:hypothetical protein